MKKIKVLLVEDSALMRILLSEKLQTSKLIDLVGVAHNGKEGALLAEKIKPDVIVTDMVMPEYDGLYLVRMVMKKTPIPIIVLSSMDKNSVQIFEALDLGAVDFLAKNENGKIAEEFISNLLNKIQIACNVNLASAKSADKNKESSEHSFNTDPFYKAVVIGASTGGPSAIESILSNLPTNFKIPIIIVQHMPSFFIQSFVKRLNTSLKLNIVLAEDKQVVEPGSVYFIPGENTCLEKDFITGKVSFSITTKQYKHFNNPSIDCLFESAAKCFKDKVLGVLLTGMGKDGVEGMKELFYSGSFTVAQDETSSVVYGMPKAAFEEGVVKRVVSLRDIPSFTVSCCDL